jgi:hypothetical protein
MVGQAHFYAHYLEIDCRFFGVSNDWLLSLYDRARRQFLGYR